MSFNYSSESLQDIHKVLMMTLHDDFDYTSAPRGKPIKELIAATFTLMNPRNRLIESPARNVNYGFAVGELCWYVRGDTDLETMLYYNKRMKMFSDDGKTINSAYGHRLFKTRWGGLRFTGMGHEIDDKSQFDNIILELKRDPDSRRAVMHINEPPDLYHAVMNGSKDVPCTMSLQLLIRDRKLHMHVLMRSNDVVWGLPYDVFSFTCLQELFLLKLQEAGVPVDDLGSYNHTAGSLHVYDTHFAMAEEVSKEPDVELTPMKPFDLQSIEYLSEEVEPEIRKNWTSENVRDAYRVYTEPRPEWQDPEMSLEWMTRRLVEHRLKRNAEEAAEYARRDAALTELVRLTEEAGGYPELEEKKEST